jgi:hypothetical protein
MWYQLKLLKMLNIIVVPSWQYLLPIVDKIQTTSPLTARKLVDPKSEFILRTMGNPITMLKQPLNIGKPMNSLAPTLFTRKIKAAANSAAKVDSPRTTVHSILLPSFLSYFISATFILFPSCGSDR